MKFNNLDVDVGINAGVQRFSSEYQNGLTPAIQNFINSDAKVSLKSIFASWPDSAEPRYVQVVAELYALAVAVRKHNSEPDFTEDDLRCAIGFFSWFLNSLKHQ